MLTVGRFGEPWSGGQSEALAGNGHREQLVADAETKVVHLVDDQEIEPVPDSRHRSICTLERGDGHITEVAAAVAQPSDVREVCPF